MLGFQPCVVEIGGQFPETLREEGKMLPIRVINSGAIQALKHLTECRLDIPPWIEAFAYDLEAAREVFTAHVRKEVRPRVEALAKNRILWVQLRERGQEKEIKLDAAAFCCHAR